MMAGLVQSITQKKHKTEENRQILAIYGKCMDFMDKNSISPIIKYVQVLS